MIRFGFVEWFKLPLKRQAKLRRRYAVPKRTVPHGICKSLCLVQSILAGAVCNKPQTICAALLCRTRQKINRLCSSIAASPANRLLKRTDSEGSPSSAEKKPLPFSVSERSSVSGLRQTMKQKEVGVKRVETLVSTLLPSAAGAAFSRSQNGCANRKRFRYSSTFSSSFCT